MGLQTVTHEDRDRAMGILGTQQCEGCPEESRRYVPQGNGHLDDCSECQRHCQCFKDTMGAGGDEA